MSNELAAARRLHEGARAAHDAATTKLTECNSRIQSVQERQQAITQARITEGATPASAAEFGALQADIEALSRIKSALENDRDAAWLIVSKAQDDVRHAEQQHQAEIDRKATAELQSRAAKLDDALVACIRELQTIGIRHGRPSIASSFQPSYALKSAIVAGRFA
jgi:hypothetical protein